VRAGLTVVQVDLDRFVNIVPEVFGLTFANRIPEGIQEPYSLSLESREFNNNNKTNQQESERKTKNTPTLTNKGIHTETKRGSDQTIDVHVTVPCRCVAPDTQASQNPNHPEECFQCCLPF